MANYNYTHGATTDINRLRFLIGDSKGTNGVSATGWLFSDEELGDLLLAPMYGSDIHAAARFCLQVRANREAILAGVAGTTDTTDRTAAIINSIRQLERLVLPLTDQLPQTDSSANTDLDDTTDMGDDA